MFNKHFKISVFLILTIGLLSFSGCAKNDPTSPELESDYIWTHLAGDSVKVEFDDLQMIDVTAIAKTSAENDGIWLQSFVSETLIPEATDKDGNSYDARNLYAYRQVAEDGFSAIVKGYADNTWEEMGKGYILIDIRKVVFPDDILDLPSAYNVKDVRHIKIFRKFDVIVSDTTGFTSIDGLTVHQVDNGEGSNESAIALADLILPFVANPAAKTFTLQAIDGYTPPDAISWTQMQTGYWLLESKKTIFTHADLQSGKYKLKYLKSIQVID
ncbi:hypothetical protein KAR48_11265 [bacterium]|nr:hypothetical protein [bacterium]